MFPHFRELSWVGGSSEVTFVTSLQLHPAARSNVFDRLGEGLGRGLSCSFRGKTARCPVVQVHPAPWYPNVAMTLCGVIGISAFGRWELQSVLTIDHFRSVSFSSSSLYSSSSSSASPSSSSLCYIIFIYVIIDTSYMKFMIFLDCQEACGLEYCNCRTRWPSFEQDSGHVSVDALNPKS